MLTKKNNQKGSGTHVKLMGWSTEEQSLEQKKVKKELLNFIKVIIGLNYQICIGVGCIFQTICMFIFRCMK